MARRRNSSSDGDEEEDYSLRLRDRRISKPTRRRESPGTNNYSDSDVRAKTRGGGEKRVERSGIGRGSDDKDNSDDEKRVDRSRIGRMGRMRNRKRDKEGGVKEDGEKRVERSRIGRGSDDEKRGERSRIGRGSDDEMGRMRNWKRDKEGGVKEDGEVEDRAEEMSKDRILGRGKGGNYECDSGSDDSGKVGGRRRKEDREHKMDGRGKREEMGKDWILGRGKGKGGNYGSDDLGSDDSGKGGERRRKEDREQKVDGRVKSRGDDEGDGKFRERERRRIGRGKDNEDSKGAEKSSRRGLEDEDEDNRKGRSPVNGRDDGGDEKRHRRRDDVSRRGGREDEAEAGKDRRALNGHDGGGVEKTHRRRDYGNHRVCREDEDEKDDSGDEKRHRRRDRGRGDKDDENKEWRNDRDRERRREYNDENVRRRSDGEDRRNVRTEVEKDNKSGREREEGGENVRDDPIPRRQEGNLNMDMAKLGRSGGVYIPPFKLARMLKEVEDKSSIEYQRMTWDALRKSINGLVNKVNSTNIKNIIPELFGENMIRGRGLFCRSCMKSQMASSGFTDVFSALVSVVNTKFPEVGDLLLRRIILQLQKAFKRNDKAQLLAAVKFIAHLVNQQVVHELIALELLTLLLRDPTDDSVEVAVGFVTECGSMLQDLSPRGLHAIFERFRGILHEGEIDKRVQFLIEGLFALRKAKFQNYPAVRPELDLVELEDQITHEISLSAEIDPEISLDIFKPDPQFVENEKRYEDLKKQILGEESEDDDDDDDDDESGAESDDGSQDDSEEEDEEQMRIRDETETNLVNLRRTIYLTIMSSVDFEEAGHKLLKIKLEPGQEMELCIMLLECCSQERTYLRYYGLLGQRFCMINKVHQENFEKCFVQQYSMIHRLETNKLRNVAKFFAHLLGTDALPWHVLAYIRLTEEDTTSSSRIFIKILFQELSEHLGIRLLNERLTDPSLQDSFDSIFPKDNPKNTRFAINFFTSIGLGGITESLREYLKNMPRLIMQQQKPPQSESKEESGSSSSSDTSDSGSSSSPSSSEESDSEPDDRRKRRRRR